MAAEACSALRKREEDRSCYRLLSKCKFYRLRAVKLQRMEMREILNCKLTLFSELNKGITFGGELRKAVNLRSVFVSSTKKTGV